ncbi:MAG: YbaB/EbfC family nucleoid-associated protein [Chloroflexi bacterium]|nr:YbaB/EbfC family nucleoid-associated protein [Chloroflexota bacterium]MBI2976010.1 YbaB/EbfC family nucleoid-associated protein [Chloroflexota bacterium]MBI3176973.1 YbaB/EbfC family nucleoid-associated protein [Chloroflexota bacterium]MBI4315268.1 YbaB/EbfC family nucleoid-associated protein [Chloroflexota bacterium]
MARGRGPRMPGNPGGGGGNLMAKLAKAQEEMAKTQEALAHERVQVSAGGGAVTVVISGAQRVQSVTVSPELLASGDAEMVGDILVAAINEAIEKSQILAAERLQAVTGGLGLPGM